MTLGCCLPGAAVLAAGDGEQDTSPAALLRRGHAALTKAVGFEFAEAPVPWLMSLSEESLAAAKAAGITFRAANLFIPSTLPIYKGGEALAQYAAEALRRLAFLGGRVMVFGSGGARQTPPHLSPEENMAAIEAFLATCDGPARTCGVTVAVEPLNAGDCNIITSLKEGELLVRRMQAAGCTQIRLLADAYHLYLQCNDPAAETDRPNTDCLAEIREAADLLVHTHIAEPRGRKCPGPESGLFLKAFADMLHAVGYRGTVSIEARFGDFWSESRAGLAWMRQALA
ncbi:MAG: sugar phosphate isomerase/epimerase family protein [Eubacteriales bacterium]